MALNEDDPEEQERSEPEQPRRPGPILHTPKMGNPFLKLIIPIGIIVALAIAGYFYYRYRSQQASTSPPTVVDLHRTDTTQTRPPAGGQQPPAAETTLTKRTGKSAAVKTEQKEKPAKASPAEQKKKPTETKKPPIASNEPKPQVKRETAPPPVEQPRLSTSSGNFSIFVGSFRSKKNAEELENRWKEAGYPTHVTMKGPWYRVSIGNYSTKKDGLRDAEKMKDAFEFGYFVDKLE